MARNIAHQPRQGIKQFVTAAPIAPAAVLVQAIVKTAGTRGNPDLASCLVAVDHQLSARLEGHAQDIALTVQVEVDISVVGQLAQAGLDRVQGGL